MGETVFDLLDGHRHIIPARLLARIESAHARELQSEKARADAAEAILRRIRDDQSWRTNDNELWRDILAAIGATHD